MAGSIDLSRMNSLFKSCNGLSDNAILNWNEKSGVSQHGTLIALNPFRKTRFASTKQANNLMRTELLKSLAAALGRQEDVHSDDQGRTFFSKDLIDTLRDNLGDDVFKSKDFKFDDKGAVTSGRPLTARRLRSIVGELENRLEVARLLDSRVKADPKSASAAQSDTVNESAKRSPANNTELYKSDYPLSHSVDGNKLMLRGNTGKGNSCFFYSVLHQLNRNEPEKVTEQNAAELRKQLFDHLKNRIDQAKDANSGLKLQINYFSDNNRQRYNATLRLNTFDIPLSDAIDQIQDDQLITGNVQTSTSWCPILADMLKRPVILFSESDGDESVREFNMGFDGKNLTGEPIRLYFSGNRNQGGHYQSVTGVQVDPSYVRPTQYESKLFSIFETYDINDPLGDLKKKLQSVISGFSSYGSEKPVVKEAFSKAENWCIDHLGDENVLKCFDRMMAEVTNNSADDGGVISFLGFKDNESDGRFDEAYADLLKIAASADQDIGNKLKSVAQPSTKLAERLFPDTNQVKQPGADKISKEPKAVTNAPVASKVDLGTLNAFEEFDATISKKNLIKNEIGDRLKGLLADYRNDVKNALGKHIQLLTENRQKQVGQKQINEAKQALEASLYDAFDKVWHDFTELEPIENNIMRYDNYGINDAMLKLQAAAMDQFNAFIEDYNAPSNQAAGQQ